MTSICEILPGFRKKKLFRRCVIGSMFHHVNETIIVQLGTNWRTVLGVVIHTVQEFSLETMEVEQCKTQIEVDRGGSHHMCYDGSFAPFFLGFLFCKVARDQLSDVTHIAQVQVAMWRVVKDVWVFRELFNLVS